MDVILLAPDDVASTRLSVQQVDLAEAARAATLQLMSFPAHRTLFSNSAVLWCRVSGIKWGYEAKKCMLTASCTTQGAL